MDNFNDSENENNNNNIEMNITKMKNLKFSDEVNLNKSSDRYKIIDIKDIELEKSKSIANIKRRKSSISLEKFNRNGKIFDLCNDDINNIKMLSVSLKRKNFELNSVIYNNNSKIENDYKKESENYILNISENKEINNIEKIAKEKFTSKFKENDTHQIKGISLNSDFSKNIFFDKNNPNKYENNFDNKKIKIYLDSDFIIDK